VGVLEDGDFDGILSPGGFGVKTCDASIAAAQFARERGVPYLGICLGMQLALVEFARNVAGLAGAHSTEFNPDTPHPVIVLGDHIFLGSARQTHAPDTHVARAYEALEADERHRNHYEVSDTYIEQLVKAGLIVSARSNDGGRVEVIELPDHPWFVGTQAHIEYKSRPTNPAPLIREFVSAAVTHKGTCKDTRS